MGATRRIATGELADASILLGTDGRNAIPVTPLESIQVLGLTADATFSVSLYDRVGVPIATASHAEVLTGVVAPHAGQANLLDRIGVAYGSTFDRNAVGGVKIYGTSVAGSDIGLGAAGTITGSLKTISLGGTTNYDLGQVPYPYEEPVIAGGGGSVSGSVSLSAGSTVGVIDTVLASGTNLQLKASNDAGGPTTTIQTTGSTLEVIVDSVSSGNLSFNVFGRRSAGGTQFALTWEVISGNTGETEVDGQLAGGAVAGSRILVHTGGGPMYVDLVAQNTSSGTASWYDHTAPFEKLRALIKGPSGIGTAGGQFVVSVPGVVRETTGSPGSYLGPIQAPESRPYPVVEVTDTGAATTEQTFMTVNGSRKFKMTGIVIACEKVTSPTAGGYLGYVEIYSKASGVASKILQLPVVQGLNSYPPFGGPWEFDAGQLYFRFHTAANVKFSATPIGHSI